MLASPLPTQTVIETPRLLLRPIALSDASGLHLVFSDPETMRYVDFPPCANLAETQKRIQLWTIPLPEWHATWTLAEKESGTPIGIVTYHHRESSNRHLEVGYVLGRSHWRQGLMREAMSGLIDYCFEALAMHRIEVTVCPDNVAAVRFTESLGFRREGGPLRDRSLVQGQYRDLLLYGLLERDWRAKTIRAEAAMIYAAASRRPELRPI